jgi:nitrogen regulatory protein PII 2
MKEVIAVIRLNMINKTKESLLQAGFPAMHCRKVMGRGKKKVNFDMLEDFITPEFASENSAVLEIVELHRLLPKRMLTLIVNDNEVEKAINAILEVNKTGNPGDGKIFISEVSDVLRVRTGETGSEAI